MAALSINDFKSRLRGGGARPSLFKVVMPFPIFTGAGNSSEQLEFLCKAAALPASTLGAIIVPFRGRQLKIAGDRTYAEWALTIINDTDFKIRNSFERWSAGINSNTANVGLENTSLYQVDAEVHQLDRNQDVIKKYRFVGVWPSEVGQIDLSYETVDAIEEYPVTIQVQYWDSIESGVL